MISLGVAYFLALEIDVLNRHYVASFFGAGVIVAMLNMVAFPTVMIAGASVGIYATYGALSARGSPYIPRKYLIAILSVPLAIQILMKVISGNGVLLQILLHSVGFVFGLSVLLIAKWRTPQKARILEVASL